LRDFFEGERDSLPHGMVSIRALNNHDAIVFWGRADRRFGVGLQRALTAICTIVEGVPMIYQEQEVGSYHYFRRLFWARQRVPEMRRGNADYLSIHCPPSIFGVLRSMGNFHAVGLVNLSGGKVEGEIGLPDYIIPAGGTILYDAISGRKIDVKSSLFQWSFEPYEVAILRVGQPPEGEIPEEQHRPQSLNSVPGDAGFNWKPSPEGGKFKITGLEGTISGKDVEFEWNSYEDGSIQIIATAGSPGQGELSLQIVGVDRWFVKSITGVYEDRLMRRHYPWPDENLYHWDPSFVWGYEPHNLYRHTLPSGRQWHSAVAPLPPQDGRIGFASSSGDGILLLNIESNAMNIVLTDRSELPDPRPYGLTLRFLASDESLNPGWVPGYQRSFWTEIPIKSHREENEPLKVTFTLAPLKGIESAMAPIESFAPNTTGKEIIGTGRYNLSHDRLWLMEPNTVEWRDLPLKNPGEYTLWMQLRHSERSPEETELSKHYHIALDGKPVIFEWARLNTWHTGNGYFGWAKAPAGFLKAGKHSLRIETSHTWLALLPHFYISRDPSFAP